MIKTYLFNPRCCVETLSAFKKNVGKFENIVHTSDLKKSDAILINLEDVNEFTTSINEKTYSFKYISVAGPASIELQDNLRRKFNAQVFSAHGQAICAVAERNLLLTLAVAQHLTYQSISKNTMWVTIFGSELKGKSMGFWGYGRIAEYLTPIYQALGMSVNAFTSQQIASGLKVKNVSAIELLKTSDVLNIQLRMTEKNKGIIDKGKIALMKNNAILINTARAGLIDFTALYNALKEGKLAGGGFDVFEEEPLPEKHPLLECGNVILTPHSAWKTKETLDRFFYKACENINQS